MVPCPKMWYNHSIKKKNLNPKTQFYHRTMLKYLVLPWNHIKKHSTAIPQCPKTQYYHSTVSKNLALPWYHTDKNSHTVMSENMVLPQYISQPKNMVLPQHHIKKNIILPYYDVLKHSFTLLQSHNKVQKCGITIAPY